MHKKPLNEPEFNDRFLIDLMFKPNDEGLRLTPEQSQLILTLVRFSKNWRLKNR